MRRTGFLMLLAGAVTLALLLLPQHPAQANEVHFDPGSPAGKEYALPLDQARDEAAGVGKSDGPAGEKAPLFGEGVSTGGGGGTGGAAGDSGESSGGVGGRPQGDGHQPGSQPAAATSPATATAGDGYPLASALLWVAAIVALGCIAGLVFRSTQRPRAA